MARASVESHRGFEKQIGGIGGESFTKDGGKSLGKMAGFMRFFVIQDDSSGIVVL